MILGLDIKTLLGFTVLGAMVSTLGALFGIILKDYFFSRSFECWKQAQALNQLYQKFRDPLLLSAHELASRTVEILAQYPTVYLKGNVLASRPEKQIDNNNSDPYFQRYKLISTIYRLSAFLSWLELYRQEITFLHPGNNKHAKKLEIAVSRIRGDLADGELNGANDWAQWKDTPLFREELRAIGESLIELRGTSRTVMGYGRYCEQLEASIPNAVQRWSQLVVNFLIELEVGGKDFRHMRLKRLLVHVVDLMRLLDDSAIEPYIGEVYSALLVEVDQ